MISKEECVMKKLFSAMVLTVALLTMTSMTTFASQYVISPEDQYMTDEPGTTTTADGGSSTRTPGDDEYYTGDDSSSTKTPGDDQYLPDGSKTKTTIDKSKAPKTGDERMFLYAAAVAAIAAAGTAVIAKREN